MDFEDEEGADDAADDAVEHAADGGVDRPLLHPDDRLWRHPSEIASIGLPGRPPAHLAANSRRVRHYGAFLSGAVGALLVIGLVTAVGGFRTKEVSRLVTERVAVPGLDATAPESRLSDPMVSTIDRAHPAIVAVRGERAEGVLNGSGFLFRSDGFILTSQHVVEGARRVVVTLADETQRSADIVGTDPDTGLGVIKVEGTSMPTAVLGTARRLRPGSTAIALGAPQWVGVGVVAAVNQTAQSKDSPLLFDMIELNASIDPLASGGPMVDGQGAVIGVVDVLDGRAFATPIDIARDVADQLINVGEVQYGYLGVQGTDADSALSQRLGLDGGAVVGDIDDGSPAYLAGLHRGDVVTDIESVHVTTFAALEYAVRSLRPGQAVTIKLIRNGQPLSINATLTSRPARY